MFRRLFVESEVEEMSKWEELLSLLKDGEKLYVSFAGGNLNDPPHLWTSETHTNYTMAQYKALSSRKLIKQIDDDVWWRRTWIYNDD